MVNVSAPAAVASPSAAVSVWSKSPLWTVNGAEAADAFIANAAEQPKINLYVMPGACGPIETSPEFSGRKITDCVYFLSAAVGAFFENPEPPGLGANAPGPF